MSEDGRKRERGERVVGGGRKKTAFNSKKAHRYKRQKNDRHKSETCSEKRGGGRRKRWMRGEGKGEERRVRFCNPNPQFDSR